MSFLHLKSVKRNVKYPSELILRLKREEAAKKHLDKEEEIISKWTESAKVFE